MTYLASHPEIIAAGLVALSALMIAAACIRSVALTVGMGVTGAIGAVLVIALALVGVHGFEPPVAPLLAGTGIAAAIFSVGVYRLIRNGG